MKNEEKVLTLLDDTINWIKILFLEDVEKDIMDKRSAIEIEHYYKSVIFSAMHTKEIVDKLETLREEVAKSIREEKKRKIGGKMKRYAIVKVQKKCPYYEVISKKCLLDFEDCRKECINIKDKFQFGDTKEQLINKIETAVAIMRNKMENKEVYLDRAVATFIVEFLGVEE